jgi:hypothetical protein
VTYSELMRTLIKLRVQYLVLQRAHKKLLKAYAEAVDKLEQQFHDLDTVRIKFERFVDITRRLDQLDRAQKAERDWNAPLQ